MYVHVLYMHVGLHNFFNLAKQDAF